MSNTKRPMNFWLLFCGLVFFCNPYFAALDPLPDFIGCLVLFFALLPLSRISIPAAEARRAFLIWAAIDALKLLLVLVTLGMGSTAERPSLVLSLAFLSCTVELLFGIYALKKLFWFFESSGDTFGCEYLYKTHRFERSRVDLITRAFVVFSIVREVVCLLPEFTALALQRSALNAKAFFNPYDYIDALRIVATGIVGACGLVMLVLLVRFFGGLSRQKEYRAGLSETYSAYLETHPGVRVRARYSVAFFFLSAGTAFLADFYLSYANIIPDYIGAALLLVGILLLQIPPVQKALTALACVLFGVAATIGSRYSHRFFIGYSGTDLARSTEAAELYRTMWISSLIEFLLFLLFLFLLVTCLRNTAFSLAGYLPEQRDEEFEKRNRRLIREEFDASFITCFIFGFFSGLCSFLYDYVQEIPSSGFFRLMEYFWIVDFTVGVAFAIYFAVLLGRLLQEIKVRYLYE